MASSQSEKLSDKIQLFNADDIQRFLSVDDNWKDYKATVENLPNDTLIFQKNIENFLHFDKDYINTFMSKIRLKALGQVIGITGHATEEKELPTKSIEVISPEDGTSTPQEIPDLNSPDIVDFARWDQLKYLLYHFCFLLECYLHIKKGQLKCNLSIPKKLLELTLAEEIRITLNSYQIREKCQSILMTKDKNGVEINNSLRTFVENLIETIISNDFCEYCIPSGYKDHAIYITLLYFKENNEIGIRIDNSSGTTDTIVLGSANLKDSAEKRDLTEYLVDAIKQLKEDNPTSATRVIYNQDKKYHFKSIPSDYKPISPQTAPNCVVEGFRRGMLYRLQKIHHTEEDALYFWLIKKSQEFSAVPHSLKINGPWQKQLQARDAYYAKKLNSQITTIPSDLKIPDPTSRIEAKCEYYQSRADSELLASKIKALESKEVKKFAVTGITGSGKSELIKKYARDFYHAESKKSPTPPLVWWFDASIDHNLSISWENLATELNVKPKQGKESQERFLERIKKDIYDYLAKHPGWLFIFDDAQSVSQIKSYIPQGSRFQGTVLVSSQNSHFFSADDKNELSINQGLKLEEAIELVRKICPSLQKISDENIGYFVKAFGCLPLAISVAAYDIKDTIETEEAVGEQCTSPRSYIDTYVLTDSTERKAFTDHKFEDVLTKTFLEKTQEKAIATALTKIKDNYNQLLNCCAWINGNEIPNSLIEQFISLEKIYPFPTVKIKDTFISFLKEQQNRSLLQVSPVKKEKGYLFMHQVTQRQIQNKLINDKQAEKYIQVSAQALYEIMCNKNLKPRSANAFKIWIPHAEIITSHAFKLNVESEPLVMLWKKIGAFYIFAFRDAETGIPYLLKAFELAQKLNFSRKTAAIGAINNYLGYAYYLKDDFINAEKYIKDTHDSKDEKDEQSKENKALSQYIMGLIHQKKKNIKSAKEEYLNAYTILKNITTNHDSLRILVGTLIGLGDAYIDEKNYIESEKKYLEALTIVQKHYELEYITEAQINEKLGYLLDTMGQIEKSANHYKTALDLREKLWGDKHPLVENTRKLWQKMLEKLEKNKKETADTTTIIKHISTSSMLTTDKEKVTINGNLVEPSSVVSTASTFPKNGDPVTNNKSDKLKMFSTNTPTDISQKSGDDKKTQTPSVNQLEI